MRCQEETYHAVAVGRYAVQQDHAPELFQASNMVAARGTLLEKGFQMGHSSLDVVLSLSECKSLSGCESGCESVSESVSESVISLCLCLYWVSVVVVVSVGDEWFPRQSYLIIMVRHEFRQTCLVMVRH